MASTKVNDYITALDKAGVFKEADRTSNWEVAGVTFNSKEVQPGYLFVCKGVHFKADYLEEAISRGAVAYVSETDYKVDGAGAVLVNDIRRAMTVITDVFYGNLSDRINMIGITGTKGKTSATYFTKAIFNKYMESVGGKEVAFCSGIDNYDGVKLTESHLTTPENMELLKYMSNAIDSGIEYMIMEVSSQALKYERVTGIQYKVGCLLNIGQDHIGPNEHEDFEDYLSSKLTLFKQSDIACVNLDCNYQDRIMEAASVNQKVITFSTVRSDADIYASDIKSSDGKVSFNVHVRSQEGEAAYPIQLAAFSTINVENALASIAIAVALKVPAEYIQAGLAVATVPGRLELFRSEDGKRIAIVDFAHNKLSYETLFEKLGDEFPSRDFIIVFGAPGMKAHGRRKELGKIAGEYAKLSIITEDDSGEESVEEICREIAGYVESVGGAYEIVIDRGQAIKRAFQAADDNTVVIVAGKGREKWIKRGLEYVEIPSDVECVNEYINLR